MWRVCTSLAYVCASPYNKDSKRDNKERGTTMATKNFTVTDSNNVVVYKGIGGDANAWASNNVRTYGDLFVHYNNKANNVLHYYVGNVPTIWGNVEDIITEWVN